MAPIRTSQSQQHDDVSRTEHKKPERYKKNSKRSVETSSASPTALPGVQKLKSALRQTRRFLARDNLAADKRVETERRLRALEADLEIAEVRRKERTMAKRYHKVKFFERRKVLRRIRKMKKDLEAGKTSTSNESPTQLDEALFELRAQLNYILNFPKLEKYISLFPPSKVTSEQNPDLGGPVQPDQRETDARREEILRLIKERMAAGELSREPEFDAEARGGVKTHASAYGVSRYESIPRRKPASDGAPTPIKGKRSEMKASKRQESNRKEAADGVAEDDFFEADSDAEASSASESEGVDV